MFLLEKICFLLGSVVASQVSVDTTFAALHIAASAQGRINFVIGDEHTDARNFRHIRGVFPPWQVKVPDGVPYLMALVVVEAQDAPVLSVGIEECCIIACQLLPEHRVTQALRQLFDGFGETSLIVSIHHREHTLFFRFLRQIPMQMEQTASELLPLISFRFGKLHIGGVLSFLQKFSNALGGGFPRHDLGRLHIPRRSPFGKVEAILVVPHRKLTVGGFQAGTAVIFPLQKRHDVV